MATDPRDRNERGARSDRSVTAARQKVVRRFQRRFFMRHHMTLILLGTFFSAFGASAALRGLGVDMLALRYALAVAASYAVFFVLVRIWLWYVIDQPSAGELVEGGFEAAEGAVDLADGGAADATAGGSSGDLGGVDLDDGAVILVVLAVALVVVFGSAAYLIYQAPAILAEAGFQVVLTGLLIRPSRKMDEPGWVGSVFRATVVPFLLTLAVVAAAGAVVQVACPAATKLADIWSGGCARPPT